MMRRWATLLAVVLLSACVQTGSPRFEADLDQAAEWLETRLNVYPNAVLAVFGAGHIGQILNERRPQPAVP